MARFGASFGPSFGQLRIGDAEREEALAELARHFAEGRLTRLEYDERSSLALAARTQRDLAVLFADLPAPERATPERHRHVPAAGVLRMAAFALLAFFAVGVAVHLLPLILIGALLFIAVRVTLGRSVLHRSCWKRSVGYRRTW